MMAKFNELKYKLLDHPAYSLNLASFDYYLFLNLKKFLVGKCFLSNKKDIATIHRYFADLLESRFNDSIELLGKT